MFLDDSRHHILSHVFQGNAHRNKQHLFSCCKQKCAGGHLKEPWGTSAVLSPLSLLRKEHATRLEPLTEQRRVSLPETSAEGSGHPMKPSRNTKSRKSGQDKNATQHPEGHRGEQPWGGCESWSASRDSLHANHRKNW